MDISLSIWFMLVNRWWRKVMVPPLRTAFKSHHVVLPYSLPSTMGRAWPWEVLPLSAWVSRGRRCMELSHSQHTADAASHEQEISCCALSSHLNLLIEFENQKPNWQTHCHQGWSCGVAVWHSSDRWNICGSVGSACILSLFPWKTAVRPRHAAKSVTSEVMAISVNRCLVIDLEQRGKGKWSRPWSALFRTYCSAEQINSHFLESVLDVTRHMHTQTQCM